MRVLSFPGQNTISHLSKTMVSQLVGHDLFGEGDQKPFHGGRLSDTLHIRYL